MVGKQTKLWAAGVNAWFWDAKYINTSYIGYDELPVEFLQVISVIVLLQYIFLFYDKILKSYSQKSSCYFSHNFFQF